MASVAENNMNTLGLGLDLDTRYQEAEKVCRLVLKSFLCSSYVCMYVAPSPLNPGLTSDQ